MCSFIKIKTKTNKLSAVYSRYTDTVAIATDMVYYYIERMIVYTKNIKIRNFCYNLSFFFFISHSERKKNSRKWSWLVIDKYSSINFLSMSVVCSTVCCNTLSHWIFTIVEYNIEKKKLNVTHTVVWWSLQRGRNKIIIKRNSLRE